MSHFCGGISLIVYKKEKLGVLVLIAPVIFYILILISLDFKKESKNSFFVLEFFGIKTKLANAQTIVFIPKKSRHSVLNYKDYYI